MIKYLSELSDRLKALNNGMLKNPNTWANHEITAEIVQQKIDELTDKEGEIEGLKESIAIAQTSARTPQVADEKFVEKLENFVFAYYTETPEKLIEYDLTARKEAKPKPAITRKLTITIQDDTDGEGFILTTQVDTDAEMYEWYKGISTDPTKTDVIPPMTLLKTTKKITFVDDDVIKGQRVFYKVRAVNSTSEGPWSEPVSRVQ
jgi:hypothetical protein